MLFSSLNHSLLTALCYNDSIQQPTHNKRRVLRSFSHYSSGQCGRVTTNEREVIRKVKAQCFSALKRKRQIQSFYCSRTHLFKVQVIIGPKNAFFFRISISMKLRKEKCQTTKHYGLLFKRLCGLLFLICLLNKVIVLYCILLYCMTREVTTCEK